jgi:hypothetical protein
MDTKATLVALEERFWQAAGDREGYEANLAHDAAHVFPGWGITDRERVLESVASVEPWQSFTMDDLQFVPLGDDAAALVYKTHAQRAGQPPYVAAMTSVYRRTGTGWELVVHHQTPLPSGGDAS